MTTFEQLNERGQGYLPGLMGIEFLSLEPGHLTSRLQVRPELLAPNGYLHAAPIIALPEVIVFFTAEPAWNPSRRRGNRSYPLADLPVKLKEM